MKLPSKVTSYSESVLCKLPVILDALMTKDMSPYSLYQEVRTNFSGVPEYIDALDCLFALQAIRITAENGVIHYVV